METLDNPNKIIDPSGVSYQNLALRQGGLAALILIAVGLITNLTGIVDPSKPSSGASWISTLINWGVMIGFTVMAVKKHRDEDLGGYITFGRAFSVSFLVSVVISVITAVWTYAYFAFIDPEMINKIMEGSMAQRGVDADQMEQVMESMSWMFSPGAMAAFGLLGLLFFGAIFSVIVSLIMKKNPPGYI